MVFVGLLLLWAESVQGQIVKTVPHCEDTEFNKEVARFIDPQKVPVIDVQDLYDNYSDYLILDARESEEFKLSHLPGAKYVGYDDFNLDYLNDIDQNTPIVVYCSIGYRSQKIGQSLQSEGYDKVLNLYGSIFEWVNRGFPLDNMQGNRTTKLHTYNRKWSKWVFNPEVEKSW